MCTALVGNVDWARRLAADRQHRRCNDSDPDPPAHRFPPELSLPLSHARRCLRIATQRRPRNLRDMLTIPPVASSCGTHGRHRRWSRTNIVTTEGERDGSCGAEDFASGLPRNRDKPGTAIVQQTLKRNDIRLVPYVPDRVLTTLIKNLHADPFFTDLPDRTRGGSGRHRLRRLDGRHEAARC